MRRIPHNWVRRSTPLLAAATLALIPLAACSDDDDDDNGGPPPDTQAPVVTADPGTQQFGDAFQVTLAATDNVDPDPKIYYTTDATVPTDQSTLYSAPIDVSATTILKYIGVDASGNTSEVAVEGYTFVDPALAPTSQQWADSGHGDILGEPFRHWDEDGEVSTSCGKCHAGEGFIDYAQDGTVDLPAALPLGHYCDSCHTAPPATLYDDLVAYPALEPVVFPSADTASLWSASNMCMVCHSGRSSTVNVDETIAATPGGPYTFVNIHYFAAAATYFGTETQGGYQYTDADYVGRNTFGSHEASEQTCVGCHMPGGPADHTFEPDLAVCTGCHTGTSFESLSGSPVANYEAIETAKEELYAEIQGYATNVIGTGIVYANEHPYFFKDLNGNGIADPDEIDSANRYDQFDETLLKAAYNYQVALKDPAGFIHNGTYLRQLLHDSIVDLGGAPSVAAPGRDGFEPSAGEAGKSQQWHLSGHADSAGEPFRHWDEDGEVSASCAKCHTSPGFIEYAQTAGVAAAVPLGSLVDCRACHTDANLYANAQTRYDDIGNHPALDPVLFPSGVSKSLGDNSNMCMVCHQGRESGVSVQAPTPNSVVQVPNDYDSYSFINRHYFAAAAILFGKDVTAAYEYPAKTYKGQNTYSPAHVGKATCAGCHMRAVEDHTWEPQLSDCSACHTGLTSFDDLGLPFGAPNVDYDGDGTGESFQLEIDGMAEILYTSIKAYANGTGTIGLPSGHVSWIVYGPGAHPYWFVDANQNGVYDEGIDVDRYQDFDLDLLRAAFNYHSAQDPCNNKHNYKYCLQTLYDSIDWMDDGLLNSSPVGSSTNCARPL